MTVYGELAGKGAKSINKSLGQLFLALFLLGISLVGAIGFIIYLLASR